MGSSCSKPRSGGRLNCGRRDADGSIVIDTRVKARSSRLAIGPVQNGKLSLCLTAPPVDGEANRQAGKLLAAAFGVAPSRVELLRGRTSREKYFRIRGATRMPAAVHGIDDTP